MEIPFVSDLIGTQYMNYTVDESDIFDKKITLKYSLKSIVEYEQIIDSPNYILIRDLVNSDDHSNHMIAYYLIKKI